MWAVEVQDHAKCSSLLLSLHTVLRHASIDPKVRAARRLPEDLIRLCVGIEDVEDLIADLDDALLAAGAVQRQKDGSLVRVEIATNGSVVESSGAVAPAPSSATPTPSLVVSAPGKVILFGEHAVVHGVTALAASVSLRCYCLLEPRYDGRLSLALPDLNIEHSWALEELPWDALPASAQAGDAPIDLDAKLLRRIVHAVEATQGGLTESDRSHASCIAFLYLYMIVVGESTQTGGGQSFTLRSLLPIGAGLGSSAAYSSSLAAALLHSQQKIELPGDSQAISAATAQTINRYAFLSEKVIHGNPSGVDNSVSVFGGCLAFTRPKAPRNALKANDLKLLGNGLGEKRLLLTDTGVGRDTKSLVASVGKQLDLEPERVTGILDEIQAIVDEATKLLSSGGDERTLGKLISRNHELLVQLGVSHPSLETIRTTLSPLVVDSTEYSLDTKLTGAGGGGCAVTLLPSSSSTLAVQEEAVKTLTKLGMQCYPTTVGGAGVSLLVAAEQELVKGMTGRDGETGDVTAASGGLRQRFIGLSNEELGEWLEGGPTWKRVCGA